MPSGMDRITNDSRPAPDRAPSEGRRDFLKGALAAGGAAASLAVTGLSSVTSADAQPGMVPGTSNHYYVPATDQTVHWGISTRMNIPRSVRRDV